MMSRKSKIEWTKSKIKWTKYPVRRCRTMHECKICNVLITDGDQYYDGGYDKP
jgi:hypothetical protein